MYPSLTHVHVGVQGQRSNRPLDECAQWDAAVRTVRAVVGDAWCQDAADMVACGEDVAWRRSVGLPASVGLPNHQ